MTTPISSKHFRYSEFLQHIQIIRYNHLVANLLVFHNAVSMTRALQELIDEGHPVTEEIIARLAPYRTDHINRFGSYELKFDQVPEPIAEDLQL